MSVTRGTVAVIGLGYVGLPLAVALGRLGPAIGYDTGPGRVASLRAGRDPSGEVATESLAAAGQLSFTDVAADLAAASVYIVAVPTPIDDAHQPDLSALRAACEAVGPGLAPGDLVIFESTVYPGCTEEVCVPLLAALSGLPWNEPGGFHVGYSPERINPGDGEHSLHNVTKVVAGDCPDTLARMESLYGAVVEAGLHRASSIKVAEAAKVIENTQRDLNIALMNELAMIFHRLDIDTLEVLEAAGTKWNFLPFRPGLVGGHCIGVDPYYLTYKAQAVGFHPQVVLGGRRTNDAMGRYIAQQTVKQLARAGHPVSGARVDVLGLAFKENCADLRNTRVADIVGELREFGVEVRVHDPLVSADEALREYGLALSEWDALGESSAVILAVPHRQIMARGLEGLRSLLLGDGLVVDVKSVLPREDAGDLRIWRL